MDRDFESRMPVGRGQRPQDVGRRAPLDIGGDGVGIKLSAGKLNASGAEELKKPSGEDRIRKWNKALKKYQEGKRALDDRIVASEEYWKQRHWREIRGEQLDGEPEPTSAWAVNTVLSKHADFVDAYPEPIVLPREEMDQMQAESLTSVLPVILQQNDFDQTWSDVSLYKLRSGTGVYGVFWDGSTGLGDVKVEKVDILNLFWEPGVKDLQESRYVFYCFLMDNEALEEKYPQLAGKLGKGKDKMVRRYRTSDHIDITEKSLLVDVYYKQRGLLHFAKYVGEELLYCTEDDQALAQRGLYDHGKYPFVFDPLFMVEGYPRVGFGYFDLLRSPQKIIDILDNAFVKSAVSASTPRYFIRDDGGVNEEEFLDLTRPLVHTKGRLGQDNIMQVQVSPMPGNAMTFKDSKIQEIKEVSGNRDVNNGGKISGITAASAIAALQEAGNSLSRDMISSSYRSFRSVCLLIIELIRQFYDMPRWFRILGQNSQVKFIQLSNMGMTPQAILGIDGQPMLNPQTGDPYTRFPLYDVEVEVASQARYSRQAANEFAIQLYQLGAFNPQMADQVLPMLDMMDFKGKDKTVATVQRNAQLQMQLQAMRELAAGALAAAGQTDKANALMGGGQGQPMPQGGQVRTADQGEKGKEEPAVVEKARANASEGSVPR